MPYAVLCLGVQVRSKIVHDLSEAFDSEQSPGGQNTRVV